MQGVIPKQAERAVRYLTKYLTKAIGETFTDPDTVDLAYEAHVDRLHAELRVPALLPALCELAALRRPTRPPRTRSGPWPLRRESS